VQLAVLKASRGVVIGLLGLQRAAEEYTVALELAPTNASYFGNRAAAFLMLRYYRQAADDCSRATELDPSFARGFARGAKANMCMGNFKVVRMWSHISLGCLPLQALSAMRYSSA
jgi:tetratricopeptide (TPR) repeat protein